MISARLSTFLTLLILIIKDGTCKALPQSLPKETHIGDTIRLRLNQQPFEEQTGGRSMSIWRAIKDFVWPEKQESDVAEEEFVLKPLYEDEIVNKINEEEDIRLEKIDEKLGKVQAVLMKSSPDAEAVDQDAINIFFSDDTVQQPLLSHSRPMSKMSHFEKTQTKKQEFECKIVEHLQQQTCDDFYELKEHTNFLISTGIHQLERHVLRLQRNYTQSYEPDYAYEDVTLVPDFQKDEHLSEKRVFKKAYNDLVNIACYLDTTRKISELIITNYDKVLDDVLNGRFRYFDYLCKLRGWMDRVNMTISDVVQIEHKTPFQDDLPFHERMVWDNTILLSLAKYLKTLEDALKMTQNLKDDSHTEEL